MIRSASEIYQILPILGLSSQARFIPASTEIQYTVHGWFEEGKVLFCNLKGQQPLALLRIACINKQCSHHSKSAGVVEQLHLCRELL